MYIQQFMFQIIIYVYLFTYVYVLFSSYLYCLCVVVVSVSWKLLTLKQIICMRKHLAIKALSDSDSDYNAL